MVNNFKPRFCAGLGIVAALMLSGCATPAAMPNPADRGELLRPLTGLVAVRPSGMPFFSAASSMRLAWPS